MITMSKGQYFTYNPTLQLDVFRLCKNTGRRLEPSAGIGLLSKYFKQHNKNVDVAIEVDGSLPFQDDVVIMNFFNYPITNKFDTIFGNPPFVKYRDIEHKEDIKSDHTSLNLYMYFIEKSFHHLNSGGEIVFIIPREFFTSTRANKIRKMLYDNGTITHIIDYSERKLFIDAAPYVVIIRYEKDNHTHTTEYITDTSVSIRQETFTFGYIKFIDSADIGVPVSTYFDVKVGIISGCNEVFKHDTLGNINVICSDYYDTRKKHKYIFGNPTPAMREYLESYKDVLMHRKIRKFTNDKWYGWGAVRNIKYMVKSGKCIYVNVKTRRKNPFFIDNIGYFDGSMLALIPKEGVKVEDYIDILNDDNNLYIQGFKVGEKYTFSQNTLSNLLI